MSLPPRFEPPFPSDDVSTPLSATLVPGNYALVFGSGLFGATGEGALPLFDDQQDIPPTNISSYIFWSIPRPESPPEWRTNLASRMRFVVAGAVIHLPGDYNVDGTVDSQDYDAWKADFGTTGSHDADGSGNAIVDAADYTVWRDHVGTSLSNGASAALGVAEPATGAIVILAAALSLIGCRTTRIGARLTR